MCVGNRSVETVGFVIDTSSPIFIDTHIAVPVIVAYRTMGTINRNQVCINTKPVTMCITISKEASLQHFVGRESDSRNDIGRIERSLFDIGKIIFGIAVQLDDTNFNEGIVLVTPYFRQIEGIETVSMCFVFGHNLHTHFPTREITFLDILEKIALRVFPVFTDDLLCFCISIVSDTLLTDHVKFNPYSFVLVIVKTECMAAKTMLLPHILRNSAVTHQYHYLVKGFGRKTPEIPHCGIATEVGFGVSLLGVNKIRKFQWITDKKYGSIITDKIPVTVFGVKFQRKSTHIPFRIGSTSFSRYSRKTGKHFSFFTDFGKNLCPGIAGDVVGDGKSTECTAAFSMYNTFRNTFPVEMGQLFKQPYVFE
ncbi:peroxisomal catalase [Odoribacter sp. CAG:788]|nr:peroxisomal catalase [Odoribacter sp. CAG:788]